MTAIVPELDQQTRDELQPPCECQYVHRADAAPPAEWVLWWVCPCPPTLSLACTRCKDNLLTNVEVSYCEACGSEWSPGSTAVRLIEPLNRRPA